MLMPPLPADCRALVEMERGRELDVTTGEIPTPSIFTCAVLVTESAILSVAVLVLWTVRKGEGDSLSIYCGIFWDHPLGEMKINA